VTGADSVQAVAARIDALGRPLLLAFDVDGTLAPIVTDPDAARVPDGIQALLRQLAERQGVHVAFVTGRDPSSLARVVEVSAAWRAVEHGRRVLAPDEQADPLALSEVHRDRLRAFRRWAESHAEPRGAALEDKEGSVAVHVRRLASQDPEAASEILAQARRQAEQGGLEVRMGRSVCEAEVESGDKGAALGRLVRATEARGVFYAGDDVTDEPAIRRARELGGLGVFVSSKERPGSETAASATLQGPDAVAELLRELVRRLA
jgi:trehalose 6-phosphate phosphatase